MYLTTTDEFGCCPVLVFQEFQIADQFWLEDQGINDRDQCHKVGYLLGPKGIET